MQGVRVLFIGKFLELTFRKRDQIPKMGIQCIYLDLYHMLERLQFPDFLASLRLQELWI